MDKSPQNELGDFLRSRRERISAKSVGIPVGRRRTPGLRREEVAQLAGIGVDWYIRLEQGRCGRPSSTTVDALAKALRLDVVEHRHLRTLANPPVRGAFVPEVVPESLAKAVAEITLPAYVTGRRWDLLAWNRAADSLFQLDSLPEGDRNLLVTLLLRPGAKRMFGTGWAEQARRSVAQFRATYDLFAGDPAFVALRKRLREGCPEFDSWWRGHDVRGSGTGFKLLRHPKTKTVARYTHSSFQSNDDPNLRLVIYSKA